MKHPATRELFAYWNDLRGERTSPQRSDINPAAIRDILADTFMLDVDLERRFPFRLAGTRVNGLFDAEQKGQAFLDLWRAEERRNIAAILLTVADGASPVVAGGIATPDGQTDTGPGECAVELLFLPLRHYSRTHSRILGLIKPTTKPAWLHVLPLGPITLRALRVIDAAECQAHRPIERIAVGQSMPASNADEPGFLQRSHPTPSHLRLIKGGLSS